MLVTVIRHGYIVTMDDEKRVFPDGYLAFEGRDIVAIGAEKELPEEYKRQGENVKGALVLPGFVNLHTHLGMVSFRSLADDYNDRLRRLLMPLEDLAMSRELVRASARLAISELLLSGTTSAVDMYFFEDEAAAAAEELGFRLWAGETFRDAPSCDSSSPEESAEVFRSIRRSELVTPVIAPHAPYSASLDTLRFCKRLSEESGAMLTMHLEEMPYEMVGFREKYGATPVEVLDREGLLDSSWLVAHLIYPSEEDIRILSQRGVKVSHCPAANAKSGKGVSPIIECMARGITIGMGTDGPASGNTLDMFSQLRIVPYLQKSRLHDHSVLPARDIVPLATRNGGLVLGAPIGQLRPGFRADIQVISRERPNMFPCYDPYSVLVYSAQVQNVKDVYVNGVQKVRNGRLCGVDCKVLEAELERAGRDFVKTARRKGFFTSC